MNKGRRIPPLSINNSLHYIVRPLRSQINRSGLIHYDGGVIAFWVSCELEVDVAFAMSAMVILRLSRRISAPLLTAGQGTCRVPAPQLSCHGDMKKRKRRKEEVFVRSVWSDDSGQKF